MNTNDHRFFKELILDKQKKVMEELGVNNSNIDKKVNAKIMENSKYSIHPAEMASDNWTPENRSYFISRKRKYLKHLNSALQRIENGEYGICVCCGQMISRARLEVVPHTQHCVPCKNNQLIVD